MSTTTIKRRLLLAVGFIGAPLVGAIFGAIPISLFAQQNGAFLFVIYAFFGGMVSLATTVAVGIPAYCIITYRKLPLLKILIASAVVVGQIMVLAMHWGMSNWQSIEAWLGNAAFALVASSTTAVLIAKVHKEVQ
jgi:hypothetical protein